MLAGDGVDYAAHADAAGLQGKRIGVPRAALSGATAPRPTRPPSRRVSLLAAAGAVIVDETDLEAMVDYGFDDELSSCSPSSGSGSAATCRPADGDGPQSLARRGRLQPRARRRGARSSSASRSSSRPLEAPGLGLGGVRRARGRKCLGAGRDDGIDAVLREHELDALVTPSYAPAIPIDLVNAEMHHGALHAAGRDGRLPAPDRPGRPGARAAGRGDVLGHRPQRGGAAGHRTWRSSRPGRRLPDPTFETFI